MPKDLVLAHQNLDKIVDNAYGYKGKTSDSERVAFLLGRYQNLTSLFPLVSRARPERIRKKRAKVQA